MGRVQASMLCSAHLSRKTAALLERRLQGAAFNCVCSTSPSSGAARAATARRRVCCRDGTQALQLFQCAWRACEASPVAAGGPERAVQVPSIVEKLMRLDTNWRYVRSLEAANARGRRTPYQARPVVLCMMSRETFSL